MKFMLGENEREDRRNTRLSALLGSKDGWLWSSRESELLGLSKKITSSVLVSREEISDGGSAG